MKKIILIIILFLLGISKVYAYDTVENFHFGKKVPNTNVKIVNNDKIRNTTIWMIYRSDNSYVYCIDPFTNETDGNYEGYIGYNELFNLSKEQINRMNLLSYYGYGYNNHTDIKWYGITQYLIWETLGFNDIYHTDSSFNNKVFDYQNEVNELNTLVNNHLIKPSFNIDKNYSINREYTLIDNNNVLDEYEIDYSNLNVIKEGNKLIISSNNPGTYTIRLIKKSHINNDYMLYQNSIRQNMFYPGKYDDVVSSINLNFISGSVEIYKQDRETVNKQGQATLEGAVYGLYKDNSLIKEVELDNYGYGIITDLPIDNYYIKEISPSIGYKLDDTKYEVNLTSTNNHQSIIVYEDVIKNKFKIIKKYGNDILNKYYLESNVLFEIYDINNNLVDTVITDENGEIIITLPYGKYTLKQISGKEDFTINDKVELSVDKIDNEKEIVLLDKEIIKKGNLEIKKIGSDNKLLDNVVFKLYAKDDIVSKIGDIYYKANDYIGEITINNGYGFINDLYYGNYYLEEISTEEGYLLNTDYIDVEINSDDNSIEVVNEIIKKGNLEIKKIGSDNKLLDNVVFKLYAKDDIVSKIGDIYYKANDYIGEITINNGYGFINDLYYGNYYLEEISTEEGYLLNTNYIDVEINNDDNSIEVVNEIIKKGNLEIKKIGCDNKLLDNVVFKLYAKDDIISKIGDIYYKANDYIGEITINNGYGFINDLYYGNYYLEEISTEEGYLLNTDYIDVEINSDDNSIEVVNEKYEIPNTLKNDIKYCNIISNIFMIIGIIGIYEIKNKFNYNK